MAGLRTTAGAQLRRVKLAVKGRTPDSAVRLARRVAFQWGLWTARFRMQPSFIVVGAQRCGTTTLYRLLEAHPNLIRPTVAKGTGYFDDNYHRGPRWYRAHFPLRLTASLLVGRGRLAQTFEMSGYYLFHPLAAQRMARDLSDIKVVVMVRDPVERAYSAHRHELARGYDELNFEEAVDREPERTAGERDRILDDPSYASFTHRHHSYLARSRYAEQIREYIEALGPDRVYVMEADRFFSDPHGEFAALQNWLGIPQWSPSSVDRWNERPRDPMPDALRERLMQYFEPYDDQLAQILGRTPVWREQR